MKKTLLLLVATGFLALLHADESNEIQIGLGVLHSSKLYKGTSSENQTIPLIIASYNDFYVEGLAVGYEFLKVGDFTSSLELTSDFLGYESSDSIYHSTLKDKESTLNAVLKNEYAFSEDFKLIGELHYDISNIHDSYSAEIVGEYTLFQNQNHTITSIVALEYMDKKKSNYYYGVQPSETNSYIHPYETEAALNSTLGLNYIYSFSSSWSFYGDVQTTFLDSTISKSPIVDRKYQNDFLVGVLYAWEI